MLMTTQDRGRTVESFKCCRTHWPHRASGHSASPRGKVRNKKSSTEVLKRVACGHVITSRRWQPKSIQSEAVGAAAVMRKATTSSFSSIPDVFLEPVIPVKGSDHDVQELGGVVCHFTQKGGSPSNVPASHCRSAPLLFLPQRAFRFLGFMFKSQRFPQSGRHRSSDQMVIAGRELSGARRETVSRDPFQKLSGP